MKVGFDKIFLKEVKRLPVPQQKLLAQKINLLVSNPFDTRLHTKSLSTPLQGIYSFRVTREYRVLFRFVSAEEIMLLTVKHRKDVYR